MPTEMLFLSDTYRSEATANVLQVTEEGGETILVVDATIFYPKGGGQPTDHGAIVGPDGKVEVRNVILLPDGTIQHRGSIAQGAITVGQQVALKIDFEQRREHARIHSAGHLIDLAVYRVGTMGLKPTKGYHYPQGAYVEFDGVLTDPAKYLTDLQAQTDELVQNDLRIICVLLSSAEAQKRGVAAPPGKNARYVYFQDAEELGCGCGGTHVVSTKEIGKLRIRKISSKKGVTRVSYEIDGLPSPA